MPRRAFEGVTALLLARANEIGHPDPERASRFALLTLASLLRLAVLDEERNVVPVPVTGTAFVEETAHMLERYLIYHL